MASERNQSPVQWVCCRGCVYAVAVAVAAAVGAAVNAALGTTLGVVGGIISFVCALAVATRWSPALGHEMYLMGLEMGSKKAAAAIIRSWIQAGEPCDNTKVCV